MKSFPPNVNPLNEEYSFPESYQVPAYKKHFFLKKKGKQLHKSAEIIFPTLTKTISNYASEVIRNEELNGVM